MPVRGGRRRCCRDFHTGRCLRFLPEGRRRDDDWKKLLAQRIQTLSWDLPIRVEYIEAAIALAEGRPADARSIASAQLDRIGPEGGNAWIQLNRELMIRCRDRALSD